MFERHINLRALLEESSLFLLGPRQTGKSTLIASALSSALCIDLLSRRTFQQLAADGDLLLEWVMHSDSKIVVIDGIQKLPELLDVVQRTIFQSRGSKRFLLTGSSARKIKRQGVNLLGGRAAQIIMHPLLMSEMKSNKVLEFMQWGTLPSVITAANRRQNLESRVSLYLDQEIRAEGLTRNIESFARFLETAAIMNTQQVNFVGVSSDVGKSEKTIAQWFCVLEDTLVGTLLQYYSKTAKRKAMKAPKFFFFDCGVANALLDRFSLQSATPEGGAALENLVFTHLSAWCSYGPPGRSLYYWRSVQKDEVDFIVTRDGKPELAIEVKSTQRPKPDHFKGLRAFAEDFPHCSKIFLCLCEHPAVTPDGIRIEPVGDFLRGGWDEFCKR
jgi:predicted AAA+ superfamily ATPase